jgi:hypothetical protein
MKLMRKDIRTMQDREIWVGDSYAYSRRRIDRTL